MNQIKLNISNAKYAKISAKSAKENLSLRPLRYLSVLCVEKSLSRKQAGDGLANFY